MITCTCTYTFTHSDKHVRYFVCLDCGREYAQHKKTGDWYTLRPIDKETQTYVAEKRK